MSEPLETISDDGQPPAQRLGFASWLATGAWIGFIPWAPGTFGSLWGVLLACLIAQIPWLGVQLVLIIAVCAIGVPICSIAAKQIGKKDPGEVVWDEIAAIPITFFLVPSTLMTNWLVLTAGFILFRIFDITKLPPIKYFESLPDGLGIMADDWVAGIFACLCLHGLLYYELLPL